MYRFILALILVLSILFLTTGGYKALLAFWVINGVIALVALLVVGIDLLLKSRKRAAS
jgi:hypothetical protein